MTSLLRLRLVAAFVACLALAAPAASAVRYLPPPGPAARRHSRRRARRAATTPARPRACASTGSRKTLRQANGRIEELRERPAPARGRSCRSSARTSNSGSAIAPGGAPPEPDVAEAPSAPDQPGRPLQGRGGRTRSIPTPIRTRPARRGRSGTTPPSAPLVRESRALARERLPGRRSNSARDRRPPRRRADRRSSAPGVAMLDQPREQFNAALQAFQAGQYPGGRRRVQGVPRRQSGASPDSGRDLLYRRDLSSSARVRARRPNNISRSRPTIPSRRGRRKAWCGSGRRSPRSAIPSRPARRSTEFGKRYPTASASVKKLAERESAKDHC